MPQLCLAHGRTRLRASSHCDVLRLEAGAADYVKVLLSGEGGDEAFAGYSNYRNILWLERFKRPFGAAERLARKTSRAASRLLHSKRIAKYVPLMDVSFPNYYYSRSSGPCAYFNSQGRTSTPVHTTGK